MKLKKLRITNYKCVHDSEEFDLGDITCLVGKNESGKSALLEALTKLNPVHDHHADFEPITHYPRVGYSEYKVKHADDPANVVMLTAELDDADVAAITKAFGVDPLKGRTVTFMKDHANQTKITVSLDHSAIVKKYMRGTKFDAAEKSQIGKPETIADLIKTLKQIGEPSEKQAALLATLHETFSGGSANALAYQVLLKRLPRFLLFTDYHQLSGRVSLQRIREKEADQHGGLDDSDRVFLALIDLANSNLDELEQTTESEHIIAELEAISNRLSDDIFKYWTTNNNLDVEFKFATGESGDPAPFNTGKVFSIRVKNRLHRVTVLFDERSTGFRWFFSFLVWLTQVREEYGDNLVILLDEPGLNLHGKAQADLLRYINEMLRPNHQVIYTTHSPFMVDPENLLAVRTVEDRVVDREVLGTKVSGDALKADQDTILPLQGALGYDITQTLFVGPNTIIVEGPSDLLYLKWFSRELERRGERGLDPRWSISPVGGLTKIGSFAVLVGQQAKKIAVVTDFAKGEKKEVERLRENEILREGHVLSADAYVDGDEADMEDLFGREGYAELVSRCYGLEDKHRLPHDRPESAPVRVVKEAEDHFKLLPESIPVFDHFSPAEYLTEHGASVRGNLSGLDGAVARFGALIGDLNKLLD